MAGAVVSVKAGMNTSLRPNETVTLVDGEATVNLVEMFSTNFYHLSDSMKTVLINGLSLSVEDDDGLIETYYAKISRDLPKLLLCSSSAPSTTATITDGTPLSAAIGTGIKCMMYPPAEYGTDRWSTITNPGYVKDLIANIGYGLVLTYVDASDSQTKFLFLDLTNSGELDIRLVTGIQERVAIDPGNNTFTTIKLVSMDDAERNTRFEWTALEYEPSRYLLSSFGLTTSNLKSATPVRIALVAYGGRRPESGATWPINAFLITGANGIGYSAEFTAPAVWELNTAIINADESLNPEIYALNGAAVTRAGWVGDYEAGTTDTSIKIQVTGGS